MISVKLPFMRSSMEGIFWSLSLLILLSPGGCGKKGRPVPYDTLVPRTIQDLVGEVREAKVLLTWSIPRPADEKVKETTLSEFRIMREDVPSVTSWCEECPDRLSLLDTLSMEAKGNFTVSGDRIVYQDTRISYGHLYVYRVISVDRGGNESEPSNRVLVDWDVPPQAPARLEGTARDGVATLNWSPVEGADEYHIYRTQQKGRFEDTPVAVVKASETSYRDVGLSNDQQYFYVVRAARRIRKTMVEGPGSQEVALVPRKLTPPAPPQHLVAIPVDRGIELNWQENTEPDLLGYFVYRRDRTGAEYRRLNELPLTATIYVDETARVGNQYGYAVTAVDRSPQRNESPLSAPAMVIYRR